MKKILFSIVLILACAAALQAQYSFTRNAGNNVYRNQYFRILASRGTSFEIRKGSLYGCGYNGEGELGIGNTIDHNAMVQVGTDSNWLAVCSLEIAFYTLALRADGSLWAWGWNDNGQLGIGNNVNQLSPVQVGTDHDWVKIAIGAASSYAIKANGTLWAWGFNHDGELGIGVTGPQFSPVQVDSAHDWVSVAGGEGSVWALKADGSMWAWGGNTDYQLGLGDTNIRVIPTQIGNSHKWVTMGPNLFNCGALQCDGSLWAWGRNLAGALGVGDTLVRTMPTQVGIDKDWVWVRMSYNGLGLKSGGTLWEWGADVTAPGISIFGWNHPLGLHWSPEQVSPSTDWVIAEASAKTFGVKTSGTVWASGENDHGQLNIGIWNAGVDTFTATANPARDWVSGAAGGSHSLAVYSDGSLWAWGKDSSGQLGLGTTIDHDTMMRVGTDSTWVAAAAGGNYSLALKSNGSLWAFGMNNEGQLGTGNYTEQHSPVQLTGTWVAMATGDAHTLALKADGTLWAWGRNNEGQLGTGNNTGHNAPVQVGSDDSWIAIAAGGRHSLAIKTDGTLWAWGDNSEGQLGRGNNTNSTAPVQVGSEHMWTNISAGDAHSMAKKADGTLWTWGRNAEGQLGIGNTTAHNTPQQVSGSNWKGINAGRQHNLAWMADGTIYAWGANGYGQLGIGNNTNQDSPYPVTQPQIVHIFTGGEANHTGIIKYTRRFVCMAGNNDHGQLGDSSTLDKNTFSCINDCVVPYITISIPANDIICSGDTLVFTATIGNGGPGPHYQWFKNHVPVGSNSSTYSTSSLSTGDVVTCVLTANAGCMVTPTDTSNAITLTVLPSPQPPINNNGGMLSTNTYNSYQWYRGGLPVAGATAQNYTALQSGLYYVHVTDANGCSGNSDTIQVWAVSVGNVENAAMWLNVYPNPVKDILQIDYSNITDADMELSDITGRVLIKQALQHTLSMKQLASGVYMLHITNTTSGMKLTRKVVKE